jgi:hypothetical protein
MNDTFSFALKFETKLIHLFLCRIVKYLCCNEIILKPIYVNDKLNFNENYKNKLCYCPRYLFEDILIIFEIN